MDLFLCVDFGSTFTKTALVDGETGASSSAPPATATTIESDVLDGFEACRAELRRHAPVRSAGRRCWPAPPREADCA